MIAAHHSVSGGSLSAKSYVRSGLIGLWDGIENAGYGQHSDDTLVWKNLGTLGSSYDATRLSQSQAWTGTGAVFHTGSIDYVFEIPGYFLRDEMAGEWSCEMVFTPGQKWFSPGVGQYPAVFGNHGSGKGLNGGQRNSGSQIVSFSLYIPSVTLWEPVATDFFTLGQIASVSLAASNASGSATTWKDAVEVASVNNVDVRMTFDREGTYIGSSFFGRDPGNGGRVFDGVIHCVRVYSRKISAAEVAANNIIDKARFNLT